FGSTLTTPTVQTTPAPGLEWRRAISRHSSAVSAAARNASRRIGIGVDPEWAAWPVKRIVFRSTPNVPTTTPVRLFIASRTERRQHAKAAVQPPAVRHRIEVAADDHGAIGGA